MIDRQIQYRRNNVIHGKGFSHPNSDISQAKVEFQNYRETKESHFNNAAKHEDLICVWKKPPEGAYKVNWDAATNSANGKIVIGVIIKDSNGEVIGTLRAP